MNRVRRIFLAACAFFASQAAAVELLEEVIDQRYPVDPGATLSITNTDGAIRVYAADVSEITIQAIKKAYTSERLNGIAVEVNATRSGIIIDTRYPPRKNILSDRSGTVEYMLIVPQATRITKLDLANGEVLVEGLRGGSATAHLSNGWLGGHNCLADLDLSIENGRLDVGYDWWETATFSVKASSGHGNLRALLPGDAAIAISARTDTGRIANGFDEKQEHAREPMPMLDTVIGTDVSATLKLEATSGNIRIEKIF